MSKYRRLLIDNITKYYVKCNDSTLNEINLEAKNLTKKLKIHDRIKKFTKKCIYNGKRPQRKHFNAP